MEDSKIPNPEPGTQNPEPIWTTKAPRTPRQQRSSRAPTRNPELGTTNPALCAGMSKNAPSAVALAQAEPFRLRPVGDGGLHARPYPAQENVSAVALAEAEAPSR